MTVDYDRPREKVAKKGIASLSDAELLQLLIGSGNAQGGVARIAKRTLKVLRQYGSRIAYSELKQVSGLGPARISQILAAFELAGRYPVDSRWVTIDTHDKAVEFVQQHGGIAIGQVKYITLDGAGRIIAYHATTVTSKTHSLLRDVFAGTITDKAAGVIVIQPSDSLIPSMMDLTLARDLKRTAQTFDIEKVEYLLVNKTDYYSVAKATQ